MNLFKNKMQKAYPVLEKQYEVSQKGFIKQFCYLKNKQNSEWDDIKVPYLEEIVTYLSNYQKGTQNKRQYSTKKQMHLPNRFLLVSDNEVVAMKASCYIKEYCEELKSQLSGDFDFDDMDDFEVDIFEDEEDTKENGKLVRIVDFRKGGLEEKIGVNGYIHLANEVSTKDVVFFTGLSEENVEEKLEVIAACPVSMECVYITPEQLAFTWVKELCIDLNFEVLLLSKLDNNYYEDVVKYLLEDEKYKFSKELSEKRLIHMIRKQRGRQFREEDIAWYLDKALDTIRKGNSKNTTFKESHFPDLFTEGKKPMEQLQEMIGLENVKRTAKEIAAIAREEMRNEKLGVLHKHMIFSGNPGTGKTTIAKILAEIMAEEGNSNANFVVAERKDLIGKYVGHTAPKVAKKFEDARGGILFVDEAGFFVNGYKDGYVTEAMKEFIRYMELYPDVTVIFAMYTNEIKDFLDLDSGLSSRINRFVKFEDYNLDELTKITIKFLEEKGYSIAEDTFASIRECMEQIKQDKKKKFGNAREARNLAESAIIASGIRQYDAKKHTAMITLQDVKDGYQQMCTQMEQKQNVFGFFGNQEMSKKRGEQYGNQSGCI